MEPEFRIAVASDDWEVINSDGLDETLDLSFDELEIDAITDCFGIVIVVKEAEKLRRLLVEKAWLRGRHVVFYGMGKLVREDIEKLAKPIPGHWTVGYGVRDTKDAVRAIEAGCRQIEKSVTIMRERKHHYYVLFHDVQNELLVPRGYVQLLGRKGLEGPEGDYLKSADKGLSYTANVLSRIPAIMEGVLVPDHEIVPVSIDLVFSDAAKSTEEIVLSGTEGLLCLGTETGIKFIVNELIRNAESHGSSDIEIFREYAEGMVNITVVNTAEKIKEAKFKSAMTRLEPSSGGHGRGLGLPVIRYILERWGGRIKYASEMDSRTVTISISIPGIEEL